MQKLLAIILSFLKAPGNILAGLGKRPITAACENGPDGADANTNIMGVRTAAVTIAFAVGAADGNLGEREIDFIRKWARKNICSLSPSRKTKRELEKALKEAVSFFRQGNKLDIKTICGEIVIIATIAQRYDILELCLRVTQLKESVTAEKIDLLKNIANWMELNQARFRAMIENILPINMHEVKDSEILLGITSDMDEEQTRECINHEYKKWNARVTSSDPKIREQADCMLRFISASR